MVSGFLGYEHTYCAKVLANKVSIRDGAVASRPVFPSLSHF